MTFQVPVRLTSTTSVPVAFFDCLARPGALDTRGGDDHVERPQLTFDARHERTHRAAVDDVDAGIQLTACGGDKIATCHGEAVISQSLHDRGTKTAAGAGDDRHWLVHMTS